MRYRTEVPSGRPAQHPPLPNADASWLEPMFDPSFLLDALEPFARSRGVTDLACRRLHIRYRPSNSGVFLHEVTGRGPDGDVSTLINVRGTPTLRDDPGQATGAGLSLLDGPLLLDGGRHVVREYPDDDLVPGLDRLSDPEAFARELFTGLHPGAVTPSDLGLVTRVQRYKPGIRLVLRCDLAWGRGDDRRSQSCLARFELADGVRSGLVAMLGEVLSPDAGIVFPTTSFVSRDGTMTVAPWLDGELLARRLRGPAAVADTAKAAAALARFHRLPTREPVIRTVGDALRSLKRRVKPAQGYPPAVARRVQELHGRIEKALAAGDGPRGLVHGDAHPGQMLIDGDQVVLLDLDRVHRGETTLDLGGWIAQHELLDLRGRLDSAATLNDIFLDAYAGAGGERPGSARLAVWTAAALLELALREMRRLKSDWPARTSAILDRCNAWLERGGSA